MTIEGTISVEWPISRTVDGQWTVGNDCAATEAAWRANETAPGIAGVIARCATLFLDTWSWPDGPPAGVAHVESLTTGEKGPLLRQSDGLWAASWDSAGGRNPIGLSWATWADRWENIFITVAPENRMDAAGPRDNGFVFAEFTVTRQTDGQWAVQDYHAATEMQWRVDAVTSNIAGSIAAQVVRFIEQHTESEGPDAGEAWLTHVSTGSMFKLVHESDGWVRCETDGESTGGAGHPWGFWIHDMASAWVVRVPQPELVLSA